MEYKISDSLAGVSGSAIREILELLKRGEIISFAGGMPAASTLPSKQVTEMLNGIIEKYGVVECLQYESTRGKTKLLWELENFLKNYKGIEATEPEMIVLAGGQQGIQFMCKTFVNKDDVVLVEDPTYLSTLQIVATCQGKCVGVRADKNGLDLKDLEAKIKKHKPKLLYVVPTFSNPTGRTYTAENRQKIAEITAKHGVMVLEDDPYSEIRFDGEPVPTLKSFDKTGNVVYVASFSKIIAPALRIAVAVGNPTVIGRFVICKQSTDVCAPSMNQLLVARFLHGDTLKNHLDEIIPIYREKRDKMMDCIQRYMPSTFVADAPEGGMFIWGHFTDNRDVKEDFKKVVEGKKVAFLPGTHFYADGSGKNTIRLNFSNASLEQIENGIRAMGEYFGGNN
jgi:2-aminoadipate transaminase